MINEPRDQALQIAMKPNDVCLEEGEQAEDNASGAQNSPGNTEKQQGAPIAYRCYDIIEQPNTHCSMSPAYGHLGRRTLLRSAPRRFVGPFSVQCKIISCSTA